MYHHISLLLCIPLSLLLLADCKHKEVEVPEPKIYFTGILETSATGEYLGGWDTTDWRLDDVWTAQETALFPNTTVPLCALKDSLEVFAAAPNPTQDRTFIGWRNIAGTIWQFRLVDEDFNLVWTFNNDNFLTGFNAISLETTDFPKDTLRLYYQAENGGCRWQGHGDLVIKP